MCRTTLLLCRYRCLTSLIDATDGKAPADWKSQDFSAGLVSNRRQSAAYDSSSPSRHGDTAYALHSMQPQNSMNVQVPDTPDAVVYNASKTLVCSSVPVATGNCANYACGATPKGEQNGLCKRCKPASAPHNQPALSAKASSSSRTARKLAEAHLRMAEATKERLKADSAWKMADEKIAEQELEVSQLEASDEQASPGFVDAAMPTSCSPARTAPIDAKASLWGSYVQGPLSRPTQRDLLGDLEYSMPDGSSDLPMNADLLQSVTVKQMETKQPAPANNPEQAALLFNSQKRLKESDTGEVGSAIPTAPQYRVWKRITRTNVASTLCTSRCLRSNLKLVAQLCDPGAHISLDGKVGAKLRTI